MFTDKTLKPNVGMSKLVSVCGGILKSFEFTRQVSNRFRNLVILHDLSPLYMCTKEAASLLFLKDLATRFRFRHIIICCLGEGAKYVNVIQSQF